MRRLAALACMLGLLAAACGDDAAAPPVSTSTSTTAALSTTTAPSTTSSTTTSTTTAAPVSTAGEPEPADECEAEETETRAFVDDSRSTPATETAAELPSRTLEVWIDRPTAPGPWPLIVFAHGLTGHPRSHELHRRSLAEQCFVVVAPAFPLTNNDVPGAWSNAGDVTGQIGDVSFLIDEVIADAELGPFVDGERIGMIGHSLGGLTTAGAAVAPGADSRISAAVVMSAGFAEARAELPVMVLHGDNDTLIPLTSGAAAYAVVAGRGVFVTLLGGDHLAGILDDDSDYGSVVRGVTGAFFALELDNDHGVIEDLLDLPLDLASIEARSGDGPLADWSDYFAA
jgi:dienelactone hydrolase